MNDHQTWKFNCDYKNLSLSFNASQIIGFSVHQFINDKTVVQELIAAKYICFNESV